MTNLLSIMFILSVGPLVGSLIGVVKKPDQRYSLLMLSFSAGVMLMVSFYELIPESLQFVNVPTMLFGVLLGGLMINFVSRIMRHVKTVTPWYQLKRRKFERVVILLIVGILFHNFPEGMAIGLSALSSWEMSLRVALAIAIHDIPEAIATTVPYYQLTGNKLQSVLVTMSTLVPTVFGFVLSYYFFHDLPLDVVGFFIAITAGIMIFISAFELIPNSVFASRNRLAPSVSMVLGVISVVLVSLLNAY
ncbi:ZIP family metal transporter [Candidatus Falkowbacteria bacterium]|nr:ZIP family metal transporter [Candidatus Falkowbacteria bacterium]